MACPRCPRPVKFEKLTGDASRPDNLRQFFSGRSIRCAGMLQYGVEGVTGGGLAVGLRSSTHPLFPPGTQWWLIYRNFGSHGKCLDLIYQVIGGISRSCASGPSSFATRCFMHGGRVLQGVRNFKLAGRPFAGGQVSTRR